MGMMALLSGCSTTAAETNTDGTADTSGAVSIGNQPENNGIVVEGLKVSLDQVEINEATKDGETKKLYTFTVTGENLSSDNKGLGSIDFQLETKNHERVELDYTLATFGNEIKPGESLTGKVSFMVDEDDQANKLLYVVQDKTLAEWEIAK